MDLNQNIEILRSQVNASASEICILTFLADDIGPKTMQ